MAESRAILENTYTESHLNSKDDVFMLISEITQRETRERALLELSKQRDSYENLGPLLWHSYGNTHA